MSSFSNFFSDEPVVGQQSKGQNISLPRGITKFQWPTPGITTPVISQVMNIIEVGTGVGDAIIELPPANQTAAFKSILFVNRSNFEVSIQSCNDDPLNKGKIIKRLEAYDPDVSNNIPAYFIYLENENSIPGRWFDIAFGASGVALLEKENSLDGNGLGYNGQTLFRVTDVTIINQASFNVTKNENTQLLINKHDNTTTTTNSIHLPPVSSLGQKSGFFVYVLNAVNTPLFLSMSAGDSINGAQNTIMLAKNVSLTICIDQTTPNNWITFSRNYAADTGVPLYFGGLTISDNKVIDHTMNSSTLICQTSFTPGGGYRVLELTLPDPTTLPPAPTGNGFNFYMVNNGDGNVKLTSEKKINNFAGNATVNTLDPQWMTLGPRSSCQVVSDGVDWFTLMTGVSSGRIVFFNDNLNIVPSHFGANLLYTGTDTKNVILNVNESSLWIGFRVTVSSGSGTVNVETNTSSLDGYKGGTCSIHQNSSQVIKTFSFGTATFVYGGSSEWWQI